jgi:hypothetical protein
MSFVFFNIHPIVTFFDSLVSAGKKLTPRGNDHMLSAFSEALH